MNQSKPTRGPLLGSGLRNYLISAWTRKWVVGSVQYVGEGNLE